MKKIPQRTAQLDATNQLDSVPHDKTRDLGTVQRILRIVTSLVDQPGESANSLARHLNLPRSTVHRLLVMLREEGFATQESDASFSPGLELIRIAGKLQTNVPYIKLAMPLLNELAETFNETATLGILVHQQLEMFFAASAFPPHPIRYNVELNRMESLAWGATGRVLLAHLSQAEIQTVLRRKHRSPLGRPLVTAEILKHLVSIRSQGYAVSHAHRTPDTIGIAAPFFRADGLIVGQIAFMLPESRFNKYGIDDLVDALRQTAGKLSYQLGYSGPVE